MVIGTTMNRYIHAPSVCAPDFISASCFSSNISCRWTRRGGASPPQHVRRVSVEQKILGISMEVPSGKLTYITMENHHAINGKFHYFYGHFQ